MENERMDVVGEGEERRVRGEGNGRTEVELNWK